jgi:hypothetical protein
MTDTTIPVGEVNIVDAQPQAEPAASEATSAEPQAEQQPETEPTSFKLKVKYNKDEIELDQDKAVEYAQKGMNYDKVYERLQGLESQLKGAEKAQRVIKEIAQESNITEQEAIERIEKQRLAAKAKTQNKPVEQLIAEQRAAALEAKVTAYETAEAKQTRHIEELVEFEKSHPDVDVSNLPEELQAKWRDGSQDLETLYKLHNHDVLARSTKDLEAQIAKLTEDLKKMQEQEAVKQINAENAAAAPGKLGEGAVAEQPLTQELIDTMTPSELDKNHEKIARFYGWRK